MKIGAYSFEEFKERASAFHGYPAPGLLIGGYMVEAARAGLKEGTLFEALVETPKCLPDAVQLLTFCSIGNQRLKVINLGRYALSLFDKYTGLGFRVHLDLEKLEPWPEIRGWFLKLVEKERQDPEKLLQEIESAGDSICTVAPVQVAQGFLGRHHMSAIVRCPLCKEAYPAEDGPVCLGCCGEPSFRFLTNG
jgi:formylmethanofuran dehydrogenase subunit E